VIQKRRRRGRDGKAYTVFPVRWYDDAGAEHSKTLPRGTSKQEAEDFERRVKMLKRTGELATLDAGRELLEDFVEEWWELYAGPNLKRSTLDRYAEVWNVHAAPRLGHLRLREVSPEVLARFRADLERAGVGRATVLKTLTLLQGILERAVEWQRIPRNPARAVRKPPATRSREITVLSPAQVEAMRDHVAARKPKEGERTPTQTHRAHRDAVLISVLAYAGLRPWSEATRLTWGAVRERTLLVHAPKTGRTRTVNLLAPPRRDLAEWRLACGRPPDEALVFPGPSGAWRRHDEANWRRRVFAPAAAAIGLPELDPYDLRHSFASLLIHENRLTIVEIAQELGHSPTMTLSTYAHVIRELSGEAISAEEQIRVARVTGSEQSAAHMRPTGTEEGGP
jgi:integrase